MTTIRTALAHAALTVLSTLSLAAFAQPAPSDANGGPPPGGAPHAPPPAAIAACNGKAVGTAASFTNRAGRTISGVCTQVGDVVAVPHPARGQRGQGGTPPSTGQ